MVFGTLKPHSPTSFSDFGQLWLPWASLGLPLAALWPPFGLPWPPLGRFLASLGLPLASPWPLFGLSWHPPASLSPPLGLSWLLFGVSEASLGIFGLVWPPFDLPWPPGQGKARQGKARQGKATQENACLFWVRKARRPIQPGTKRDPKKARQDKARQVNRQRNHHYNLRLGWVSQSDPSLRGG